MQARHRRGVVRGGAGKASRRSVSGSSGAGPGLQTYQAGGVAHQATGRGGRGETVIGRSSRTA